MREQQSLLGGGGRLESEKLPMLRVGSGTTTTTTPSQSVPDEEMPCTNALLMLPSRVRLFINQCL